MYISHHAGLVYFRSVLLHRDHRNIEVFHKKRYEYYHLGKIKGSIVYFTGFVLIVLNLGLFGAIAQIAGFILIFRTFLPDLYDYICKVPVVGGYLSKQFNIKKAIGFKMP